MSANDSALRMTALIPPARASQRALKQNVRTGIRWRPLLAGAVAVLLVAGVTFEYRTLAALRVRPAPAVASPKRAAPTVTVAQPVRKTIDIHGEYVGQLDSPQTVELRARVLGYLKEINFKDGAEVQQGELLFVIDAAPYEVALLKAKAQLQTAVAVMAQARDVKDVDVDKANLKRAEATYANDRQITQDNQISWSKGAVPREAVDNAVTAEKMAAAAVESAKAVLAQAEADYITRVAQAEATLANARAVVADAELNLSYTRVYAPMTGRIGRAEVKIGALVGTASDPTLLATISQIDPVWAYFSVSEREAFELQELLTSNKLGERLSGKVPVRMTLEDGKVYAHEGTLNYTSRTVDTGTGTLTMRAEFPNPGKYLRPGHYAKISVLVTEKPDALLISERAIGADQGGKYVLLVNNANKVERRAVKVGPRADGMIVIETGLNDGERVVVNGLQHARAGSEVAPIEETATAAQTTDDSAAKNVATASGR